MLLNYNFEIIIFELYGVTEFEAGLQKSPLDI
jgi:hypothetical protein